MARLIKVRGGWMYEPPPPCPAGHRNWAQSWSPCDVCQTACVHWRCRDCPAEVRDPDHEHSG